MCPFPPTHIQHALLHWYEWARLEERSGVEPYYTEYRSTRNLFHAHVWCYLYMVTSSEKFWTAQKVVIVGESVTLYIQTHKKYRGDMGLLGPA